MAKAHLKPLSREYQFLVYRNKDKATESVCDLEVFCKVELPDRIRVRWRIVVDSICRGLKLPAALGLNLVVRALVGRFTAPEIGNCRFHEDMPSDAGTKNRVEVEYDDSLGRRTGALEGFEKHLHTTTQAFADALGEHLEDPDIIAVSTGDLTKPLPESTPAS